MSYSPSVSLVRLQELKLWQGNYEDQMQKLNSTSNSIKSVSPMRETIFNTSLGKLDMKDWDKREISPTKPFEQLLEEKLAEDEPIQIDKKPKQAFLRKGQGIARFKMTPIPAISKKTGTKPKKKTDSQKSNVEVQTTNPQARKGILKKPNIQFQNDIDLTPLAVPDFVKPRGTWRSVLENGSSINNENPKDTECLLSKSTIEDKPYENFRRSLDFQEKNIRINAFDGADDLISFDTSKELTCESHIGVLNKSVKDKIKEFAVKRFAKDKLLSNDIPESLSDVVPSPRKKDPGDNTIEEQRSDRELKKFELLEQKVENSSFCSTNTSIINLLASTPQKSIVETDLLDKDISFMNDRQENIKFKLKEIDEKTDILRNFLVNLNKVDLNGFYPSTSITSDVVNHTSYTSTGTSFSDEDTRWSTRSPSLVDHYTEYDSSYPGDSWKKIDIGVNTSFDSSKLDDTIKNDNICQTCEDLKLKLSEKSTAYSNIQSNNMKLRSQIKEWEAKYDQIKKQIKNNEIKYTEKIDRLEEEVENERRKFVKEKTYFENYVKDAQNRPTKKEREEIVQLKQELADAKELLKLKDSKNGATQARLRTQLKQHEKEVTEMKITVEKLQKENSKLSMTQKYMRRPAEVKMLQEINKNLSKLTEETFKKKVIKSGHGDTDEVIETDRDIIPSHENKENKTLNKTLKETERKSLPKSQSKRSVKTDNGETDCIDVDNNSIERQYENVFGSFSSPRNNNCSSSFDKAENVLSDGTIEITYSNGNFKTISSDGQIIKMQYFNGDTKETDLKNNIIRYHYAATNSVHTQYPDGSEVVEYPEGQKYTKFPDGRTEISYVDGSLRTMHADGMEEQQFADGRKTVKKVNGEQIIFLPNGQKEIHTEDYKRREYPDGTVRTLYKDGTVETIYSNGRVRLKDSNGTLIMDTHQ